MIPIDKLVMILVGIVEDRSRNLEGEARSAARDTIDAVVCSIEFHCGSKGKFLAARVRDALREDR